MIAILMLIVGLAIGIIIGISFKFTSIRKNYQQQINELEEKHRILAKKQVKLKAENDPHEDKWGHAN